MKIILFETNKVYFKFLKHRYENDIQCNSLKHIKFYFLLILKTLKFYR